MDKAVQKIRSRRGASISFALLLFLVCATVGSVVLAAATAASGRFSALAESDQRYYSVTSAAGLLKERYDGGTVTAERKVTVTSTQKYNMGGSAAGEPAEETETEVSVNGTVMGDAGAPSSLLENAAWLLAQRETDPEAWSGGGKAASETLTLKADGSSGYEQLSVSITEDLYADGTMILILRSAPVTDSPAVSSGEIYRLQMIFEADQQSTTNQKEVRGTPKEVAADAYQITTTTTTTTVTTTTWNLTGIYTY